jgi:hypothetical protein
MLVAFLVADAATGRLPEWGGGATSELAGRSRVGVLVPPVRENASALQTGIAAGVVALMLLGSTHFLGSRWAYARKQQHLAAVAVTRIDALGHAVVGLGGRAAVLPCRASTVTINHSLQTALAWKLGTTLERVQTVLHVPGLAFVGPWDSIDGGPPPIDASLSVHREIRRIGPWRIFEVYGPGPRPRCIGS